MINQQEIKRTLNILEKEINETNSLDAKSDYVKQSYLYYPDDKDEQTYINNKCIQYLQDLIDEDYDPMWSRFYLAQDLMSFDKSNNQIIKLFKEVIDDERSKIYDTCYIALHHLGCCYRDGIGTDVDYKKAIECFDEIIKASDMADPYIELGDMYLNGQYFEKDYNKAFECYQKAYDKTIEYPSVVDNRRCARARSLHQIGLCFLEGYSVKKDPQKAIDYFEDCEEIFNVSHWYDIEMNINDAFLEWNYNVRENL